MSISSLKYILPIYFLLAACSLSDDHVREYTWKNNAGFWKNHDVLFFGGGYMSLRHDTIFQFDSAVAVISGSRKGYLGKINEIYVRVLRTNEELSYTELSKLKPSDTVITIDITPPATDRTEPPPPPPSPPR